MQYRYGKMLTISICHIIKYFSIDLNPLYFFNKYFRINQKLTLEQKKTTAV